VRLRGALSQARVRRRRASAAERLATAFGGGREVEFGAVDGVYRAAEQARRQAPDRREAPADHLPARARQAVHLYTRGGRARALVGARVGRHIDVLV